MKKIYMANINYNFAKPTAISANLNRENLKNNEENISCPSLLNDEEIEKTHKRTFPKITSLHHGRVIKKPVRRGIKQIDREIKKTVRRGIKQTVKNMNEKSLCHETTSDTSMKTNADIQIFHKILQSPGLFWIGEKIFIDLLDQKTFAQCDLVCSTWRWFFIEAELWKKWLMKNIASTGTYRRHIVNKFSTRNHQTLEEAHQYYRSFAFKFTTPSIHFAWKNGKYLVKKLNSFPIVRDLKSTINTKMVMAEHENVVVVAHRDEYISDDDKDPEICKFKNIQTFPFGHRREVTCLDMDEATQIVVSGSRDRSIVTWDLLQGSKLNCQKEAHSRLITSVKIYEDQIFSSSRDRSIKVWDLHSVSPIQTLTGPHTIFYHNHSVWSIDICENYLISASADQTLGVWQKETNAWHFQHKLNNEEAVRNVIILKKSPNLALSGDLIGDLKVWNLRNNTFLYQVPHPDDSGLFRKGGVIVSLAQSVDTVGVAYSTKSVALFSALTCDKNLLPLRLFRLDQYLEKTAFIRNICLSGDGDQLWVCNVSGQNGVVLFDIWQ